MTIRAYARTSSTSQNLSRQLKQLEAYGYDELYQDQLSGKDMNRDDLQRLINDLEEGDVIIVSDLTRITRSTQDLFKLIKIIKDKKATLKSIKDTWLDTSSNSPYSQFLLTIMAGVNQLERDLIKERQMEGITIAKEKGIYKGRLKKYHKNHHGMNYAIKLYYEGNHTVSQICQITQLSKSSLYRALKDQNNNPNN